MLFVAFNGATYAWKAPLSIHKAPTYSTREVLRIAKGQTVAFFVCQTVFPAICMFQKLLHADILQRISFAFQVLIANAMALNTVVFRPHFFLPGGAAVNLYHVYDNMSQTP